MLLGRHQQAVAWSEEGLAGQALLVVDGCARV